MKDYLTKSQKIKASCILHHNNKIFLLRSNQVTDVGHRPWGGYFDIPSVTIPFGEDPKSTLKNTLIKCLGDVLDTMSVLDVRQYVSDNKTTQVFEVLFTAKTINAVHIEERLGIFMFVDKDELDLYMFPQERARLKKYL